MCYKLYLSIFLVIVFLFLVQCATTGPGGKKSLILLSTDQEVSIGKEMAGQVEKDEKLSPDTVLQNYLNNLGQKIAKVSDRPNLQYRFRVIESDQINAFAAPGGYIYFYTGLMKIMDSEAELAAVMGHEISHVVARHGVRRMQQVIGLSILLDLALGKSSAATQQAVGIGIELMLQGYSRENELESDDYGALYMARAGYNPQAMISMFKKLEGVSKGGANVIEKLTSSHPTPAQRIAQTEKNIAKWGYQKSDLPYFPERYKVMKGRIK